MTTAKLIAVVKEQLDQDHVMCEAEAKFTKAIMEATNDQHIL